MYFPKQSLSLMEKAWIYFPRHFLFLMENIGVTLFRSLVTPISVNQMYVCVCVCVYVCVCGGGGGGLNIRKC